MPRIELIDVPLFSPNDPYHWEIDNVPLKALMRRQNLINMALDNVIEQMRDAIGTQGSFANRLNQSLNQDGSIKTAAIDEALHSIEEHEDTDDYVRLTRAKSDKVALIADEATDIVLEVETDDDTVTFDSGTVRFEPSSTVTLSVDSPNIVTMHMAFPVEAAHRHYYGLIPVNADLLDPDYINFKVNSLATPYTEGSLRVYVNGVRLHETLQIYVPGPLVDDPWTLLRYTPDYETGTFALSAALSEDDVILVDFDVVLD